MDYFILLVDYTGTVVFAISGALAAMRRRFDVFGIFILALVTAVGGGTLRDLLIGSTPVAWMLNKTYLYLVVAGVTAAYLLRPYMSRLRRSMFLFDTIGIALYTILGLQKALAFGLGGEISVMLGVVSAVFGGVVRDVLAGEPPLIFRREIYASACLVGGTIFLWVASLLPLEVAMGISILTVFLIRFFAVRRKWSLEWTAPGNGKNTDL